MTFDLKNAMKLTDIPREFRGLLEADILNCWHASNDFYGETLEQFLVRMIAEGGMPAHYNLSLDDLEAELDCVRHPGEPCCSGCSSPACPDCGEGPNTIDGRVL